MEIEVRNLTGQLRRFSISPNETVSDLKKLVAEFFPTPAFHLFFKGVKLSLQSCVRALGVRDDEFLVIVPFAKKRRAEEIQGGAQLNIRKPESALKAADTSYDDLMQELSTLRDGFTAVHCAQGASCSTDTQNASNGFVEVNMSTEFLKKMVHSSSNCITEGQNCEDFIKILCSCCCLRNPELGKCGFVSLSKENFRSDEPGQCSCPAWLLHIVKVFSFVNMYSAFVHVQNKSVTVNGLKKAMNQLTESGFKPRFQDIEKLNVLCPKVVSMDDDDKISSTSEHVINILNSHSPDWATCTKSDINDIFTSMKIRDKHFRKTLWEVLKLYMETGGKIRHPVSLDDLLEYLKSDDQSNGHSKVKRRKINRAGPHSKSGLRCLGTTHLSPTEMIDHLKNGIGLMGQIVHVEHIEGRQAKFVDTPQTLSIYTKNSLERLGISKLYCHQAESILASLAGKNVVVATMTSSGKSLCYNIPVLEVLTHNMASCALYLFPTKALSQDQSRVLASMTDKLDSSIQMGIYDGDTSNEDRLWLRSNARLLITNPDMLHMSILPSHKQFSRILSQLRFIVIDEAHAYKGVFGCHTALIIRRLLRLCTHVYGSDPAFIFSTATLANPREHCMELANLSTLELIQNDGSPSTKKLFVLWNPSVHRTHSDEMKIGMDADTSDTRNLSPILEVSNLLAEMVQHGLRCIAFCRSRKLTEIILSYTREILLEVAPHLVETVCAYRAGYIAEDRRKFEKEFFSGKLYGMAATNALELGIDVGHVDATLHLGFPGSIASLWQQAGRSGRRDKLSLAVYVAFDGPLDQYFMNFPTKLFGGQIECCHIDSTNPQILKQHLICAAFEHPISLLYDEKYFGHTMHNILKFDTRRDLIFHSSLDPAARRWSYIGEKMPSSDVSIRSIEKVRYKLINLHHNTLLEEIEESKAFFQIHEGAVYMHQGRTYLVKELNLSEKVAYCEEANVKYYTKTRDYTDIHVIGGDAAYPTNLCKNQSSKTTAQTQWCNITTTWFGFHRIQKGTTKILDTFELSLPSFSYQTQAVWIRVHQHIKTLVEEKSFSFRGGLHAASHTILNVVPLYVRCNLSDLAPECPNPHDTRYYPERILVYDHHPGGSGLSNKIQPLFSEILNTALELLKSCHCSEETGCPHCLQSMVCHEYNQVLHKQAAIMIIQEVLESERQFFTEENGE